MNIRPTINSCAVICFLFLAACSSSTRVQQPVIHYAPSYSINQTQESDTAWIDKTWWTYFQSDSLNNLMQTANQQSLDLLIIAERVKQAEYQMKIADASWFPSLNASASSGERKSEAGDGTDSRSKTTSANIAMQYEIDLWGGVAASRRSTKARANADIYNQVAAVLSTKAAIATGWFEYLALQQRIATSQKNIRIAENIQRIVEAKYKNGAATAGEVAQQKTSLLNQRAGLLPLQLQAKQTASALAILLGESPIGYTPAEGDLMSIQVPEITAGVPAALIARRPDLAATELELVAANADIVQARAALLPSFNLSATAGKSAAELFRLNPATSSQNWAISLTQTLFSGGRLWNQKRVSDSRATEMLLQYHKTILVALQEVDDSLASADINHQQEVSQYDIVKQAEISLHTAKSRYTQGSSELITLLDAQRSYAQAQDALVQQRLARLRSAVNLYKALGGGWQKAD